MSRVVSFSSFILHPSSLILSLPARLSSRKSLPDWLPRVIVWPSILSVVAHATLLAVFATTVRSCHQAHVGFTTEASREVGIVIKQVGDNPDAVVPGDP